MTEHAPRPFLLTGFEPFGDDAVNPSWEIAHALDGEWIGPNRIVAARLPCVFGKARDALHAAIEEHSPALVLALGLWGGRSSLTLERVAINLDDARIPDNEGAQPVDRAIVAGGPNAYFATLPVKAMRDALRQAGIPVELSQSAGTYVCNHVFYGLMHALAARPDIRGGFMHVPWLPEQSAEHPGAPTLSLATALEGVRAALRAAVA